jgi:hypothetical protein
MHPPEYISSVFVLPADVVNRPLVEQMKWSTEMRWPGSKLFALRMFARSLITVDGVVPGAGRRCCFPYWHAAHFGKLETLHAAAWIRRLDSV